MVIVKALQWLQTVEIVFQSKCLTRGNCMIIFPFIMGIQVNAFDLQWLFSFDIFLFLYRHTLRWKKTKTNNCIRFSISFIKFKNFHMNHMGLICVALFWGPTHDWHSNKSRFPFQNHLLVKCDWTATKKKCTGWKQTNRFDSLITGYRQFNSMNANVCSFLSLNRTATPLGRSSNTF